MKNVIRQFVNCEKKSLTFKRKWMKLPPLKEMKTQIYTRRDKIAWRDCKNNWNAWKQDKILDPSLEKKAKQKKTIFQGLTKRMKRKEETMTLLQAHKLENHKLGNTAWISGGTGASALRRASVTFP